MIPNDRITVSICVFRPTERTEYMSKQKSAPRIPLFSERREPSNRDKYIYGSEKYEDKISDTFPKAFSRYMSDSVHPTAAGYLEWWTPVFEAYFQEHM